MKPDTTKTSSIYEQEHVYGVDTDLTNESSNRLAEMIKLASSLKTAPKTIMDLGCGTGYFAAQLKKVYPESEVYDVDISAPALEKASQRHPYVKFVLADAEAHLPFSDNKFDLVISGENIEHIVDTDLYLIEINRVLSENGHLIITTPNLGSWMNRVFLLIGRQPYYLEPSFHWNIPIIKIGKYNFPEGTDKPASGHLRLFTLDALRKLLIMYGFQVKEARGYYMLRKPILSLIDLIFCHLPSFAFGLVVISSKVRKAK
jgi:SAM-dependent methyltransferase